MTTHVILGGGLGNQLFQTAAGLFVSAQKNLILETGILTPNQDSRTELSSFDWPEEVSIRDSSNRSRFEKRLISFCIREGAAKKPMTQHKTMEFLATILMSILRRKKLKVFINHGVGYDQRLRNFKSDIMLIGYFQCFHWPMAVQQTYEKSINRLKENIWKKYVNATFESDFNLLHVRLGDYMAENSFGIPGTRYFQNSVKYIRNNSSRNSNSRILVFSDSPEHVSNYLDDETIGYCNIVESSDLTAAENLIVMSTAKNFIISNSTYSWWAAFLAGEKNATVVFPDPWFKRLPPPVDLIPPIWVRQDANFN